MNSANRSNQGRFSALRTESFPSLFPVLVRAAIAGVQPSVTRAAVEAVNALVGAADGGKVPLALG